MLYSARNSPMVKTLAVGRALLGCPPVAPGVSHLTALGQRLLCPNHTSSGSDRRSDVTIGSPSGADRSPARYMPDFATDMKNAQVIEWRPPRSPTVVITA